MKVLYKPQEAMVVIPVYNALHAHNLASMLNHYGCKYLGKQSISVLSTQADEINFHDDEKDMHSYITVYYNPEEHKLTYNMYTHLPLSYADERRTLNKRQLKRWLGKVVNEHGDTIPLCKFPPVHIPCIQQRISTAKATIVKSKGSILTKIKSTLALWVNRFIKLFKPS